MLFILIIISFILGLITDRSPPNISVEDTIKLHVLDFLFYPKAATFNDLEYKKYKILKNNNEIGFYCGKVFGFKNELPYGYKRFLVRVIKKTDDKISVAIPLVEDVDNMLPKNLFDEYWLKYCH